MRFRKTAAALMLMACGGGEFALAQSTPGTPGSTGAVRDSRSVGGAAKADASQYWFSDERIRRDLGLTPQQYERLVSAYGQTQTRYNDSLAALERNRSLTSAERAAQIERLRGTFNTSLRTGLQSTFTNQDQLNRFNQLDLQYQGYGAFNEPSVREQLLLSDEQLLRMNQYARGWNSDLQRLRAQYRDNPTLAAERLEQARQQTLQNINGVLTPQQQTQWGTLTGNAYDFGAPSYFGSDGTVVETGFRGALDSDLTDQPGANPAAPVQPGRDVAQPVQPGRNPAGPVQPGRNPAGPVQPGRNPAGDVQPGKNPAGPVQPGRNPAGPVQPGRNPAGPVQPGANPAGPVQPGANPTGGVQPGANPAGPVQPGANPTGGVQPGANPAGPVQPGANPSNR